MKLTDIIEKLQKQNPESIVLVKNGIFFIATGKDAITLSNEIGLKLTCMKENLCKVGFLVKSVEKYIRSMKEKDLSFIIYMVDKQTAEAKEIFKNIGKAVDEKRSCLDCSKCTQKKETEEEILERLMNLN